MKHKSRFTFLYGIKLFITNIWTLIIFEILYKTISVALLYPLITKVLRLSVGWAKLGYVSNGNVFTYLSNPSVIVTLSVIILTLMVFTVFEMMCIIICYEASRQKRKINIITLLRLALIRLKGIFLPNRIILFIMSLFLVPMSAISLISGFIYDFNPDWLDITKNIPKYVINIIAAIFLILMLVVSLYYLLVMHYVVINGEKTNKAFASAFRLLKKRLTKSLIRILLAMFAIIIIGVIIYAALVLLIAVIINHVAEPDISVSYFLLSVKQFYFIFTVIVSCFIQPLFILTITTLYYRLNRPQTEVIEEQKVKKPHVIRAVLLFVFAVTLVINIMYFTSIVKSGVMDNVEALRIPTVSAHRGSSYDAPENTLASIQAAIDDMADYAEIDVRPTKDGKIVLSHDESLKRTTGLNKLVGEVTYEEIEKLDAGSWFSEDYAGEKIPLLEQVLELCDNKLNLNIEIKSPADEDSEDSFVENLVALIKEYNFEDQCVVTSFNYDMITKVKELDEDIKTGLISTMFLANTSRLQSVDAVSLNNIFITQDLVDYMHNNGKKVFAWTVNSTSTATKMLSYGVDNIITDNPVLIKEVTLSSHQNRYIMFIVDKVFKQK